MNNPVNMITLVGEPLLGNKDFKFSWNVIIGKPNLIRLLIMSQIRSNYMYLNPTSTSKDSMQAYTKSVSLKDVEVGYVEHFDYEEVDALRVAEFATFVRKIANHFGYDFSVFIDAYDWGPFDETFRYFGIEAKRFKLI
jgi:hypothetical protein